MDVQSIQSDDQVDESVDDCLAACRFFQPSEVRHGASLECFEVEIKKFLELGPEDHAYLAEVAVQGRAVLLGEVASVPVVYGQHQQYGVDVVSSRNTAFEVVEEELNAGSEKRPEDLCGAVASHIEKLCSKDDLM